MSEIYEPQEDSWLLREQVEKHARGRVLDMGTGSGVQAEAAARKPEVLEVVAADINPEAVLELKSRKIGKVKSIRSDLFSNVKGRFDVIAFNPPYLPDDKEDPDIALDGGPEGHELIERFLQEAAHRLNPGGIILLLYSSRTGKKVAKAISSAGLMAELLSKKALPFFEELYVYRLIPSSKREVFARGKRGIVYIEQAGKKKVCVKEKNPEAKTDSLANEARFLKILNGKGIGPKFISFDGKSLRREFAEGTPIGEWLEEAGGKDITQVITSVLKQCRELDRMMINKTELTNPYKDIIITPKKRAVMIDFERCKKTEKPQNVTQFLQYLSGKTKLFENNGILLDIKKIPGAARAYKHSLDDKTFAGILSCFSFAKSPRNRNQQIL